MSTPLLIACATVTALAVLKAAQDKLNDHWDSSIFARLSGGDKTHFFGHRDFVWLRRYPGRDSKQPKHWPFRVPLLSFVVEAVYDFYHLAASMTIAVLAAALVALGGLAWWWWGVLWLPYVVFFEVFYRRVYA